jgi:signal transduction histidine kinase
LVGDISHQLRSRLTALSMRLEEVAVNSSDPDSRAEAGAALEQSDRLSGVIDELLAQARQDRLRAAVPVDMGTELMSVRIEWEPALRSAGRTLQLSTPEETHALATPGRLHQAIGVLVDNALRHGGGPVRLAVRTTEQYVVVEVTDDGPGVPPELVGRLFERGVSGSRGTGLGLALARALIEADGGRLELRRARPATFAIYLLRPAPDRFGTEPGPDPSAAGTSGAAAGGPADEASSSSAGSGSAASLPSARKTQRL